MKELKILRRLRDSLTVLLTVAFGYLFMILILFVKPVYKVYTKDLKLAIIILITLLISRIFCNLGIEIIKKNHKNTKTTIVNTTKTMQPSAYMREAKGA